MFALNQPDPEPAPRAEVALHRGRAGAPRASCSTRAPAASSGRATSRRGCSPPRRSTTSSPTRRRSRCPAGIEVVVVVSQTPALQPALATSLIVPLMTSITELKHHQEFANQTGLDPDNEIWPGDDLAFNRFLERLSKYGKVVVLSGEVHFGYGAELSWWKKGTKRLTLAVYAARRPRRRARSPRRCSRRSTAAGLPLSEDAVLSAREDNGEWSIVDPTAKKTFLVRDEEDRLDVFEEAGPARVAQFVSSGIKNAKDLIATLGAGAGLRLHPPRPHARRTAPLERPLPGAAGAPRGRAPPPPGARPPRPRSRDPPRPGLAAGHAGEATAGLRLAARPRARRAPRRRAPGLRSPRRTAARLRRPRRPRLLPRDRGAARRAARQAALHARGGLPGQPRARALRARRRACSWPARTSTATRPASTRRR